MSAKNGSEKYWVCPWKRKFLRSFLICNSVNKQGTTSCNLGLKNFSIHPCLRVSCLENNCESTMVNHVCCHMLAHVIDLTLRV